MLTISIILIIYIASAYKYYTFVQKCYYHPLGRWNNTKPDVIDILYTFTPIMNTVFVIMCLFYGWKRVEKKKPTKQFEFFEPRKPFK